MSQPDGNVDDVQAEWMARLVSHGMEAGYTLEDDRFKQLFATAMLLETLATTAINETGTLSQREEYEEATRRLTYVIDDGERYFAQHPKSLAEEAYGYALTRLYFARAATRLIASGQTRDGANQLQRALNDANKALSYPSKYYDYIAPTLCGDVGDVRDLIQTKLKQGQQGKTEAVRPALSATSDSAKMIAEARLLETKVEKIKAELYREDQGDDGNPYIAEQIATQGIDQIQAFFNQYEQELARKQQLKDVFGAYLVTFRGSRGRIRFVLATQGASNRKQLLINASTDVEQTLNYPASYFNNPRVRPGLLELQTLIREAQNKKEGCFIATAAYGSPLAPEIDVLRRFRDTKMRPHRAGRWMIDAYERCSPPVADVIGRHPTARLWVRRVLLTPVIHVIQHRIPA